MEHSTLIFENLKPVAKSKKSGRNFHSTGVRQFVGRNLKCSWLISKLLQRKATHIWKTQDSENDAYLIAVQSIANRDPTKEHCVTKKFKRIF